MVAAQLVPANREHSSIPVMTANARIQRTSSRASIASCNVVSLLSQVRLG